MYSVYVIIIIIEGTYSLKTDILGENYSPPFIKYGNFVNIHTHSILIRFYCVFFSLVVVSICFCSSISIAQKQGKFNTVTGTACIFFGVCLLVLCYSLSRQPQSSNRPTFHVIIIFLL